MVAPNKQPGGGDSKGNSGYHPRRFFTTRNGRKVDAWDYGYKAWPIGKSQSGGGKPSSN